MAFVLQNKWSLGEVDEKLLARIDYEGFYKSALRLHDVIPISQGGLVRRFGTIYKAEVPAPVDDNSFIRVFYNTDVEDVFIFVFSPNQIQIYDSSLSVYGAPLSTPYKSVDLSAVSVSQNTNSIIIVHGEYQPKVVYLDSTSTFQIVDLEIKNPPAYDFHDDYKEIEFWFGGPGWYDWSSGSSVAIPEFLPKVANKVGAVIHVKSSHDFFAPGDVSGYIAGWGAVLQIESYINKKDVKAKIKTVFNSVHITAHQVSANPYKPGISIEGLNFPSKGKDFIFTSPIFNNTNGWPRVVTIFQNRLVLAGVKVLPQIVACSVLNSLHVSSVDYDAFIENDTASIIYAIASYRSAEIVDVYAGNTLNIFTKSGVFSTPMLQTSGLSPSNFAMVNQCSNSIGLPQPVSIDNQILFIENNTNSLRSYTYSNDRQSFLAVNVGLLSQHLLTAPKEMFSYTDLSNGYGEFCFIINTDGSLITYHSNQSENISSFSYNDLGTIISGDNAEDKCIFLVKRVINGSTNYYLEELDFDIRLDSSLSFTYTPAQSTVSGLEHLEGESVVAYSGNRIVGEGEISGGSLTLNESVTSVTVGINYVPEIIPMPPLPGPELKMNIYNPLRIKIIYLDYYKTLGLTISDIPLQDLELGDDVLNPSLKSGSQKINLLSGWDIREQITIKQNYPYPLLLRGIGYIIE